jgi:S-DNA-T family DNA segregation ATPase FtsK/SpoIIIE
MVAVIEKENTVRGLREVAFLFFASISLFFLISLITFSNEDAGWTHSGTSPVIKNAGGVIGAWLADFSLSFFGLMAFLFPIMLFWHGYLTYTQAKKQGNRWILAIRWSGFIATLLSGAALFYLHLLRVPLELPTTTGGIIGQEIGDQLSILLGDSGATLLLLAVFLAGITLFTGLSWFKVMDLVGKWTLTAMSFIAQTSRTLWEKRQNQRRIRPSTEPTVTKSKEKPNKKSKLKIAPVINTVEASKRSIKEKQIDLFDDKDLSGALPPLSLLEKRQVKIKRYSEAELEELSRLVEDVLQDYNIVAEVVAVLPGPVITRFELQLAAGVKVSRITGLAKDLARGLSVTSVRVVEVIEGKSVIGLEIPNQEREIVALQDLLASKAFEKARSNLTLAMGKDIAGKPVMADLAKMPHALVAGTTGSGKSVAINTMILSLLYKSTPEQIRLIMIDPKMLELSVYEGIPHLLTPVVTDMKDAQNALRWSVAEMERRYKLMSKLGVRNIAGYNQLIKEASAKGAPIPDPLFQNADPLFAEETEIPTLEPLPSIVIVIDELADMMMIVGKKVEELIARLAQKARAAGIHLILATQRPSVDVLTGLIKANIPTRISFQVSSRIDSRTVLDQSGAEALLGNGDMLFLPSGTSIPIRAHGAFVDDNEVHRVVEFLKKTGPVNYLEEITQERSDSGDISTTGSDNSELDSLYDEAVAFVTESRKASISSVQRRFKVGYNRAARMIEEMEAQGVVSAPQAGGSREVIAPPPPKD